MIISSSDEGELQSLNVKEAETVAAVPPAFYTGFWIACAIALALLSTTATVLTNDSLRMVVFSPSRLSMRAA